MKKRLLIFVLLILLSIGIEYEGNVFYFEDAGWDVWLERLSGVALLLVYQIPLGLFICRLWRREKLSFEMGVVTFLFGCFITGWIAAYLNAFIERLWIEAIPNQDWLVDWNDALAAPWVEEGIKCLSAIIILYFYNKRNLTDAFIVAMVIGFCFQVFEDFNYVLQAETVAFDMAVNRMIGFLSSHWMLTSVTTYGVWGLWLKHKQELQAPLKTSFLWLCAIAPTVLHFLWNGPIQPDYFSAVISAAIIYIWGLVYLYLFRSDESNSLLLSIEKNN